MTNLECPKEKCWHYIPPGGAADMSGKVHKDLHESFEKGEWKSFPEGGCSCVLGSCSRIDSESKVDFFEPMD